MTRRFARLYADGSLGVETGGCDLVEARTQLDCSSDDETTELVEVELRIIRSHGKPKLKTVRERCIICPTCSEEIWIDEQEKAST